MLTEVYSDSANLGDNLALTPLLNHQPCRLHLFEDPWVREMSPVLEGLAAETVWFTDKAQIRRPDCVELPRPWTKRVLGYYGLWNVPAIPRIKLTEAELEEGRAVAATFKNPVILKANPCRVPERCVPLDIVKRVVAANPDVTFIHFGFSPTHQKAAIPHPTIPGTIDILDAPIRKMAAVYAAVGRYVGADTGDFHLMTAVGGRCDVFCPPHSGTYNHHYLHYGPDCWLEMPRRVEYHPWCWAPRTSMIGLNLT